MVNKLVFAFLICRRQHRSRNKTFNLRVLFYFKLQIVQLPARMVAYVAVLLEYVFVLVDLLAKTVKQRYVSIILRM